MDLLIQIALFVLLGVLLYYIDSAILTGLYRVVYNMTHRIRWTNRLGKVS